MGVLERLQEDHQGVVDLVDPYPVDQQMDLGNLVAS